MRSNRRAGGNQSAVPAITPVAPQDAAKGRKPKERMETRVEAFVLAGGRSSRFGANKALARVGGKNLLQWALSAAENAGCRTPRVVCRDPDPYRRWAVAFVLSERRDRGPAEGIRAILAACATPWALVLGTDMPGVDGALLRVLLGPGRERAEKDAAGAVPRHRAVCFEAPPGSRHPLPGLYHRLLLERFGRLGESPSLNRLLDEANALVLGSDDLGSETALAARLRNVNRPEDLKPGSRSDPLRQGDLPK